MTKEQLEHVADQVRGIQTAIRESREREPEQTEPEEQQIVGSCSLQEIRDRRAAEARERENELMRLATMARDHHGELKDLACADLLAFLGVIHPTPQAKADWIRQ